MDYKRIFELFKEQYMGAGGYFSFSLFPILFSELKKYGFDRGTVTDQFAKDLHSTLIPDAKPSVLLLSVQYISHYSSLMLVPAKAAKIVAPVTPVETKAQQITPAPASPTPTAKKISSISIDYDSPIPREEDEGDPLYTPPDQIIHLKPEDCADAVTDWEFIKTIDVIRNRR